MATTVGQWRRGPGNTFSRVTSYNDGGGAVHGAGVGSEQLSGFEAAQQGLINPASLTGIDMSRYLNDRRMKQQIDAAWAASSGGGSGGIGGGASSNPYKDILAQAQAEQDKANAANEARYQQALGISDQMLSTSEGMGQQERADIGTTMANAESRGMQALISRGLSGSTLRQALMMSRAKNTASAEGALNDRLKSTKMNILSGKQNVIASKKDSAPDMSLYSQLIQQMGAGGYGSSGGYSGGSSGGLRSSLSGSGSSTSRPRPWSPNYHMSQGLGFQDAVAAAGGAPMRVAAGRPYVPGKKTAGKATPSFWQKAVDLPQRIRNVYSGKTAAKATPSFWKKAVNLPLNIRNVYGG